MADIVTRWEWRTFGRWFAATDAVLATLEPSAVQQSDELYLLAPGADNVKIRDGLVDIKVLRATDAAGLERWEPVLKAAFPLSLEDRRAVFGALRLRDPDPGGALDSLDAFLAAIGGTSRDVRSVAVHKRRVRYELDGAQAESSELTAAGRRVRTIAVESSDPRAVQAAIHALQLDGYRNINVPRGLTALVDDEPERYAVIDVGTNSLKLHVGELLADDTWRTVADRAEVTRLGEGIEATGAISDAARDRTVAAFGGMAEEARRLSARAIVAVGTAGVRKATNQAEVGARLTERAGVPLTVIPGDEEGRLAYVAVQRGLGLDDGSIVVFDTGGGSSQFTFGQGAAVHERFSVEVGAVRFTERFGLDQAVSAGVIDDAAAAMATDLERLVGRPRPDRLVAMGGATTNLAAVMHGLVTYDPEVIQGSRLTSVEVDRQIELYRSRDADARRAILGLQPKRAEVILAGACIVRTVMALLGVEAATVSDRGLRHGLLAERFGRPAREGVA